jgi:uncharacterized protein (TIGR03083 family)
MPMDWPQLRAEIVATTARVGDLLRALPGDTNLSRVGWSAAELGAHLVSLPRRYQQMAHGPRPLPPSLSAENDREVAALPERDPAVLAGLLAHEVGVLLDVLGDDGDTPAWYFTVEHTAAGIGGILLTELLLHGLDLACAAGRQWPITRALAVAGLRGVMPAIVVSVSPAVAERLTGTFHVHLRGGDDWTIHVDHGDVRVAYGRPRSADLHLSADPVTLLLNAYGFVGPAVSALTGGIVVWGRKPWLAARFRRLFIGP